MGCELINSTHYTAVRSQPGQSTRLCVDERGLGNLPLCPDSSGARENKQTNKKTLPPPTEWRSTLPTLRKQRPVATGVAKGRSRIKVCWYGGGCVLWNKSTVSKPRQSLSMDEVSCSTIIPHSFRSGEANRNTRRPFTA